MTAIDIGNALKYHRTLRGYKQEYVSASIHISRASYSNYEHGRRNIPLLTLCALADLYEITTDELLHVPEGLEYTKKGVLVITPKDDNMFLESISAYGNDTIPSLPYSMDDIALLHRISKLKDSQRKTIQELIELFT